MGMVQWLVKPGEEVDVARSIATRIAQFEPMATQAMKAAVGSAMSTSVEMGLQIENELMSLCFARKDMDAIKAAARQAEIGG